MAIIYKNTSPYFDTVQKNVFIEYLDVLNLRTIPKDETDEIVAIESKHNERPDLLSTELYGTPDLWWVLTLANMDLIKDPIFDFTTGKEIRTPTKDRVFTLLGL